MTVKNSGGNRIVALAKGKKGVFASVDGGETTPFKVVGEVNAANLAKALDMFTDTATTLLIIGTRSDGTPGWDGLDPTDLSKLVACEVHYLSEAQAFHREYATGSLAAYIILATTHREGTDGSEPDHLLGSARWWVEGPTGVERVDVQFLGENHGQIYTIGGGSLTDHPYMVARMVEDLLEKHPHVLRVYVWSQDGLKGNADFTSDGIFMPAIQLPNAFRRDGGRVIVLNQATEMLEVASKRREVA